MAGRGGKRKRKSKVRWAERVLKHAKSDKKIPKTTIEKARTIVSEYSPNNYSPKISPPPKKLNRFQKAAIATTMLASSTTAVAASENNYPYEHTRPQTQEEILEMQGGAHLVEYSPRLYGINQVQISETPEEYAQRVDVSSELFLRATNLLELLEIDRLSTKELEQRIRNYHEIASNSPNRSLKKQCADAMFIASQQIYRTGNYPNKTETGVGFYDLWRDKHLGQA